ncbi:hypothetical protein [Edaphosphingomonas haloaromaticamans]|uniref:Uncharacterized protein n=1 Tax=Edaphosphingomonas haloaromaticamans TaxID=653954 RepID=A0A1S1HAF1_9SPHN|nr:hypothetical protein [Sphingomonas haloaromaticamans]OHT18832.1 hypothetical protein BHE75_00811 [Sphingomonas haloaromaticamans]
MNTNIDDALARLASDAPYRGLTGLEDRVLSAIARQPAAAIGTGTALITMGLALTLGVFSNVVPAADAQAAPALSPLGAPSPLAPSSLLTEPR